MNKELVIDKLFSIKNKVALVTGGSRGIGKHIAKGFVLNGGRVYITSRKKEECLSTEQEFNAISPESCVSIAADLSKMSEIERIVSEIKKREEKLHILVNNAGCTWGEALEHYPESAWNKVFDLNVKTVFYLTREILPLLEKAATTEDPARIINIGSIDGIRITHTPHFAYSASKAAVHHMTQVLALQFASKNITVNAIAAGVFPTKMMAGLLEAAGSDNVAATVPRKRLGAPSDVAGISIYLCSPAGSWVTGAIIPVDGGYLIKPRL